MAKPRVFISSTFYDLRQIRADLDQFIKNIGYEPIRNEIGNIPYGKDERLEEYCIQEVGHSDILISILGGRFGSESKELQIDQQLQKISITQRELKSAISRNKQVYVFIDKNVSAEYQTYLINKDIENIKYRFVDDIRIYNFIEEIKNFGINNNIKEFETSEDIITYLREQFAGLFQRFLDQQLRLKEFNIISELEKTSQNLNKLVEFLSTQNNDKQDEIDKILMLNHPLVTEIRSLLSIPYNFYILGFSDLNHLLNARGYFQIHDPGILEGNTYSWQKITSDGSTESIRIKKNIFDKDGKLLNILPGQWDNNNVTKTSFTPNFGATQADDLPF